jgi:hypothetical protein
VHSRHCFLEQIFSILIAFIDSSCAHVEAKSSSQHLSDKRRRTKSHEFIKMLLALSVIVRSKVWHQDVIHLV